MKYALIATLTGLLLASCSKDATSSKEDESLFGTWRAIGELTPGSIATSGGPISYPAENAVYVSFVSQNKAYFRYRNNDTILKANFTLIAPGGSSQRPAFGLYGPLIDTDGLPTYYDFRNDSLITYHGTSEYYYQKVVIGMCPVGLPGYTN